MRSYISNSEEREAQLRLLLVICMFLLMISAGLALHFTIPLSNRSNENYLASALDLRKAVESTSNGRPRILLVGGSSLGFSVSSEKLTQKTGLQTYNLGVIASMGYQNIWNFYLPHTSPETDIIILSPEYSLLLYDGKYSKSNCDIVFLSKSLLLLIKHIQCIPATIWRTLEDLKFHINSDVKKPKVYYRSGHNEFGDVISHLDRKNRKIAYHAARPIKKVKSDNIDKYIKFITSDIIDKGYKTLIIPTIIPNSTCKNNMQEIEKIGKKILNLNNAYFDVSIFPDPVYCLPDNLFFDTIYHLNKKGRQIKTEIFTQWIEIALKSKFQISPPQ